jgi:hypothetical protein
VGNASSVDAAARVPSVAGRHQAATPLPRRVRPAPRTRPSVWTRWGWEVLLIVTLAGALPLLVAAHYHSLGQPTSDD